MVHIYDHLME